MNLVASFRVGIDNFNDRSYCDFCDSTIWYGEKVYIMEDEQEVDAAVCQSCFAQILQSG